MKIALFLPTWLGDLVMATPAIRAFRRHFGPDAHLVGIMRANLADLLAGTDWLSEQWHFDPHGADRRLGQLALLKRMRRERFDMAVLLTNSLRPALISRLAGSGETIGYIRGGRGPLLTGKVHPQRSGGAIAPWPMVDYYLQLAEAAGCGEESRQLELATTDEEMAVGQTVWDQLGLRGDGRVIALNSSGAYGVAKLWPDQHFGRLAQRIVDETDHDVLVICGPHERDRARSIVAQADRSRVFSLAEQPLGLPTSKACISRSRLMVSTDSGPRHIAAAFGKPVVTLLGPTVTRWIENPTVHAIDVQHDLDCLGCARRVCPLKHHRCMKELSADRVYEEVARLIEPTGRERAA